MRKRKKILLVVALKRKYEKQGGSKSTSLSSGFSDVIKAARYDLLTHCLIS